jgi:hypothetical protein
MDPRDELVELLGKRFAAGIVPNPRTVELAADLYGLGYALRPFISAPTVDVDGYRRQGQVHRDGSGFVVESVPYGGSVIDGYNETMHAVLASGAVLTAEQPDMHPSCVAYLHGDSPELDAVVAHADQNARVHIEADHSVWLALRYRVLALVRERVGWPARQNETLAITVDGKTVRFTYDGVESWSGDLHLDGS